MSYLKNPSFKNSSKGSKSVFLPVSKKRLSKLKQLKKTPKTPQSKTPQGVSTLPNIPEPVASSVFLYYV